MASDPLVDWPQVLLGDLVRVKHGWPFKSEAFSTTDAQGPVVVAIGNFQYSGGFRFESTTVKRYTADYPREYELHGGEILVVMTCQTPGGEILGVPGRIPRDGNVYLHNQRMGLVEPKSSSVDESFLYWLFLSRGLNRHLVSTASGTKILHTAPSRIESYEFRLPPLAEQKAIAGILGALDDKIELNRRMSATLEEMARTLFKSWFVDFDPVHAKAAGGKPYGMDEASAALFPADFEDSELGPIPQGWRVGTVGDLVNVLDSKRIPLSKMQRQARQGKFPYYGATSVMDYVDDYLFDGTYVLVGEDGSVVQSDGSPFVQYVWGKFWVNNHAHVLTPVAPLSAELLLQYMKSLQIAPYVTGAVQAKLSQGNLLRIPVPIAAGQISSAYGECVAPWYQEIRAREAETRCLIEIRDSLLPRLLSGELRVQDAERVVSEAV